MTTSTLFAWMTVALVLQLALAIGFYLLRHKAPATTSAIGVHDSGTANNSLFWREVVPFAGSLLALILLALAIDAVLHVVDRVWIGRYLGIPGTLMILASLTYSLRKRKLIQRGHPMTLLRLHEYLAWSGALLVLVHAGIHFNGLLGWLAVGAMMLNVASGLTGKFLLGRARRRLEANRQALREQGLSDDAIEQRLHWDSLTFDMVRQWRVVHLPVTAAFAVLAIAHILAIFLFWAWR